MKKSILFIILVALAIFFVLNYTSTKSDHGHSHPHSHNETRDHKDGIPGIEDGDYTLKPAVSHIHWTGKIKDIKSHSGDFDLESGTIIIDESEFLGDIIIDMNSLSSDSDALSSHLKNEDFFDTANYPQATFRITKFESQNLVGDLTIKDHTQTVSIPVQIAYTDGTLHINGNYDLDRTIWNIRYGSASFFDNLGDKAIDDIVPINFNLEFVK